MQIQCWSFGLVASKGSWEKLREVDLNEILCEQTKRLLSRLEALQKTVVTGRRFFPHCSEVLNKFLADDMPCMPELFLEEGISEERRVKKMRYMELKEDLQKAFDKDKAENKWAGFSSSSSSTSSPKGFMNCRVRKR